jgi:hypothetical protein
MHAMLRVPLVVVLGLCVSMVPIVHAASDHVGQSPSAAPLPLHNTPPTSQRQGLPDPLVTVKVHALVPEKVKLSDPAQGTIRATVLTLDKELNQVTVQTHEGQRLVLYLTPESFVGMRVGVPCLLQVAQGTPREPARPPERDGAFW